MQTLEQTLQKILEQYERQNNLPLYPYNPLKLPINLRENVKTFPKPHDWLPKLAKKTLSRHIFSPILHNYQMDIMTTKIRRLESGRGNENQQKYLFLININTRYLYVFPIAGKTLVEVYRVLSNFIQNHEIKAITTDREAAWFTGKILLKFFDDNNIKVFYASPKYTMSLKIVDRAIKTIRDSGANVQKPEIMQQIVYYYNNSIHRTIGMTPSQMQANPELEKQWIRKCIRENDIIKQRQYNAGLYDYQPGNILYMYLDDKTHAFSIYTKRTRNFSRLGIFVRYEHHNVVAQLLIKNNDGELINYKQTVIVPIYFTRFCADNLASIPRNAVYYCV
jgi:hypothetical protein